MLVNRKKRSIMSLVGCATILAGLLLLSEPMLAQINLPDFTVDKVMEKSNDSNTASEGLLAGATPTYVNFNGFNGIELTVSRPRTSRYDYTLMFWVRSVKSYAELRTDPAIKNIKNYLFKLENSVGCYIQRLEDADGTVTQEPQLTCESGLESDATVDIVVPLSTLKDIQSWMHMTYSAIYRPASALSGIKSNSYLRIDISSFSSLWIGGYKPIVSNKLYYGAGGRDAENVGFMGHYRQMWITVGYIDQSKVPNLMHEYKVLDYSTMAYYRFDQSIFIDRYEDAFRIQKAQPLGILPEFIQENISAPYCNSIPALQVDVPQFYRSMGSKFSGIQIPRFKYRERYIGYTASFWMKNFGEHAFEPNPAEGRANNHIFSLDESFALWYDSKTSFRVYVYAKNNFFETFSDSIFLPLNEWVNIQVTISQSSGITVMTFNQNGERQQLVQNKIFLAEQYPRGTISFFQSFIGIPYKLCIWEQFIELPVVMEDPRYEETLLIQHDFTYSNFADGKGETGFEGWRTLVSSNGENLPATIGDGFDFVIDNVPSAANFYDPKRTGQLQATSTDWKVTCPAPAASLMYLMGEGAKFDMTIMVEKTDTYTIEFWFKADVEKFTTLEQDRTFIFMMNGRTDGISVQQLELFSFNSMVIYVENNELKCAPFGFVDGELKDEESVLTYSGVNPLLVSEWQHISCMFKRQKYVKGQYLKVNFDEEGVDLIASQFREVILRPFTFAKALYQSNPKDEILIQNYSRAQRWNIILGNDPTRSKTFFGSFKDVRVWKSLRSDADLYTFRFNQANKDDNLEANLKFMDGSFDVYNDAERATNGPRYPKNEMTMNLLPTSPYNIVCAVDTYFNIQSQSCTRYPYTSDPSMVYSVENNIQHGHKMVLSRRLESTMKLPGPKFQPQTKTQWAMVIPENAKEAEEVQAIIDQYFGNSGLDSYSLDPIVMGDYKEYGFSIEITDTVNHNFFLLMNQKIVPRKCMQVVDSETKNNQRNIDIIINDDIQDLVLKFEVQRIDGCADEYFNKLQPVVKIETQPPIKDLDSKVDVVFDVEKSTFELTAGIELLKSPAVYNNIPIDFIVFVFWSSAQLEDRISYMNVVYTITLAYDISVGMAVTSMEDPDVRVISVGNDPDLAINAICSRFFDGDQVACDELSSAKGISFKWECAKEGEFQNKNLSDYCAGWNGAPVLVIPQQLMRDNELVNKPIQISVVVSALEASEQEGKFAKTFQFRVSRADRIFKWVSTRTPRFTIEYPQPNNFVLITSEQTIKILPQAWKPSDGYEISFKIMSESKEVFAQTAESDKSKTFITLIPTTDKRLVPDSEYTIEVTATRTSNAEDEALGLVKPFVLSEKFKTGSLPYNPGVDINPRIGITYATEFTISMTFDDPNCCQYLVQGIIVDEFGAKTEIRLTDTWKNATQPNFTGTFPKLDAIKVSTRNNAKEVVFIVDEDIQVNKQEGVQWLNIIEGVRGLDDQKWQKYLFIASDSNGDAQQIQRNPEKTPAERKQSENDARQVNDFLATSAFNTVRKIDQDSTKRSDEKLLTYIIGTIAKISQYTEFMEPIEEGLSPEQTIRVIQQSVETLEYALRIENIMMLQNANEVTRAPFVRAIGQLLDVTATRAQIQKALLKYTKLGPGGMKINWNNAAKADSAAEIVEESSLEQEMEDLEDQPVTVSDDSVEDDSALRFLSTDQVDDWQVPQRLLADDEEGYEVILTVDEATNEKFLALYRDLIVKIITIKNSQLDSLCLLTGAIDQILTTSTLQLQQSVIQIARDSKTLSSKNQFIYTESVPGQAKTDITANIPVEQLMKAAKVANNNDFEWICVQVSFMKPNPAAGFEPNSAQQFFFDNQRIMQLGMLDSKGRRLLEGDGKIEGGSINMSFAQQMDAENYFFNNQTFCANYNSDVEPGLPNVWTNERDEVEDCQYTYIYAGEYSEYGTIECSCSKVSNYYYTVMTDLSRERLFPMPLQDEHHVIMYAVLVPLIMIGLIFPCLMIILDGQDYQNIEDNVYPVDDLTIAQLEKATNKLCKQTIYYNEKEISRYLELNENEFRSGSCVAFSTFQRTLHPYFSLFYHFDYRSKRLTRFGFVLGQISLITIMLWAAYTETATTMFSEMVGWEEEIWMERRQLLISIAFSIVTLPFPDRCCCWFKTTMYLLNDSSKAPDDYLIKVENLLYDKEEEGAKGTDGNEKDEKSKKDEASKKNGEGDALVDAAEEPPLDIEKFVRPTLYDEYLWCKLVGLICIFLLWIGSISITFLLLGISGKEYSQADMDSDVMKRLILLTPDQAQEFVITWLLTIFVWGVIINELRILIISLMAPIQAQNIFNKQMELMGDPDAMKDFHTRFCSKASCSTCCLIPPESVEIALDALFTIDIKLNRDTKKYQVKDEERTRFRIAKDRYEKLQQESLSLSARAAMLGNNKPLEVEMSDKKKKSKSGKNQTTKGSEGSKRSKSSKKKGSKGKKK